MISAPEQPMGVFPACMEMPYQKGAGASRENLRGEINHVESGMIFANEINYINTAGKTGKTASFPRFPRFHPAERQAGKTGKIPLGFSPFPRGCGARRPRGLK